MSSKNKKVYVQFSKKLITAVMIFWCVVRLWSVIATWLSPEVGSSMITGDATITLKSLDSSNPAE